MIYKFNGPSFRHSDLRQISKSISIRKTDFFYENISRNLFSFKKEFKTKKYSKVSHDIKKFKNNKKFLKRSSILTNLIKREYPNKKLNILDFGCGKGDLLLSLKKKGYKNLFGYDVNPFFKNDLKKNSINFFSKLKEINKKFDLIIFSQSISYVENIFITIKQLRKTTSPTATMLINVQNIDKRPLSFFYADQKYYFCKNMITNLFNKYGKITFFKSKYLEHEIILKVNLKKTKKIFRKLKVQNTAIKILKDFFVKLKKIDKKCNILDLNLVTVFISSFLRKKVLNIVNLDNSKFYGNHNEKNIISLKKHISMKLPLIVLKDNSLVGKLGKIKVITL